MLKINLVGLLVRILFYSKILFSTTLVLLFKNRIINILLLFMFLYDVAFDVGTISKHLKLVSVHATCFKSYVHFDISS